MSSTDLPGSSTVFPPGHPAGTDAPISAGAVLSGRGQRAGGGSLGPSEPVDRPTEPVSVATAVTPVTDVEASGPTVLIAVEDTEESVNAVRTAHRLFGDAAHYFVINVGMGRFPAMGWAPAYPVAAPMMWYPPTAVDDPAADSMTREVAEETADDIATQAGLDDVTAVGDLGDPATAIIHAADANQVDVVVIAAHDRGWFSRLFSGSVEGDLLRSAAFSVLVVR